MKAESTFSLSPSRPVDLSKADEPTLLNHCERILLAALAADPAVASEADDIDPAICTSSELLRLIGLAQSRELRMYFFGIFLHRENVALVSGQQFGRVDGSLQ